MVYRAIGVMSGSSLDGLDIAFVEFHETAGLWHYEIVQATCYPYPEDWSRRLGSAVQLSALDYQLLHTDFGAYIGNQVNRFIEEQNLYYQVALIASHGHTTFHVPAKKMTAQLGDGAAIAAITQLPVVTDLRALDLAFGGQGAPIVPIGEKLLLHPYTLFLNVGGIANIAWHADGQSSAFDVCPANRVLDLLVNREGKAYDEGGKIAATGSIDKDLLERLNNLEYYGKAYPKSLANDFGTDVVFPLVRDTGLTVKDSLRTYVEHIAIQVRNAVVQLDLPDENRPDQLLVTGGGAFNSFLISRLQHVLNELKINVIVPDARLINFKEALIMAFMGVLRWRQEYNVLSSVTGAARDSIGGALWTGQEA